jgi:hypothetical protein
MIRNALPCFLGTWRSHAVDITAGLMTPTLALLLPCLLGPFLACDYENGNPGSEVGFTVHDSMGLVIAESRQAVWDSLPEHRWSIDTVPLLQVGSVDDSIFARVYPVEGAIRLDDGRIVVAGKRHTILWFNDRGEYLFERGKDGDGPGEFRSISRMIFLGPDSVAAYSGSNRSWTVFDGEGRGKTIRLSALNRSTLRPARSPDGRWLGWLARTLKAGEPIPARNTDPGNGLPSLPARELDVSEDKLFSWLVALSPDGMHLDTLAEVVGPTGFALMGMPVVTGTAGHIVLGEAQEHALLLLTPEGTPVRSVRWAGEDLTISPADHAAWRESLMADRNIRKSMQLSTNPAAVEQAARAGIAEARLGARKGAYLALFADPEEAVWVLLNTFRHEPELYTVINAEGRYLGEVRMPPNFVLNQVGRDFVLGLWRDEETDLEFVRMYRIRKP